LVRFRQSRQVWLVLVLAQRMGSFRLIPAHSSSSWFVPSDPGLPQLTQPHPAPVPRVAALSRSGSFPHRLARPASFWIIPAQRLTPRRITRPACAFRLQPVRTFLEHSGLTLVNSGLFWKLRAPSRSSRPPFLLVQAGSGSSHPRGSNTGSFQRFPAPHGWLGHTPAHSQLIPAHSGSFRLTFRSGRHFPPIPAHSVSFWLFPALTARSGATLAPSCSSQLVPAHLAHFRFFPFGPAAAQRAGRTARLCSPAPCTRVDMAAEDGRTASWSGSPSSTSRKRTASGARPGSASSGKKTKCWR
jgi:hypothetical protein